MAHSGRENEPATKSPVSQGESPTPPVPRGDLPKLRVSSPTDRPASSPYIDPATGEAIPIEKGDWRRTGVIEKPTQLQNDQPVAHERNALDPNQLDFGIERQESRLPDEGEVDF
ncbi:hypothetical protein BESB_051920 [Besnoitia besnoiti]|uniref:Uncharacterized protein n=1 Tax=Besnoitia besnoiti TaxID=94643 RepID=A0A2A9MGZ9_BESBE|nr:hypothetical protein BESB_051920 [Besnoitia besnoiti]PFH35541.1 hypothetical protein BESB_051920 [Besnoitia besnoiti]